MEFIFRSIVGSLGSGRRMVMCRGEQWSSFLGQLLGLNEALDL